jgi:hypothetical protein
MPIFILRAVRSRQSNLSQRVADQWKLQAADLSAAQEQADKKARDHTWDEADAYEIADGNGNVLSSRPVSDRGEPNAPWS